MGDPLLPALPEATAALQWTGRSSPRRPVHALCGRRWKRSQGHPASGDLVARFWRFCELRRRVSGRAAEYRYAGELMPRLQVWSELQTGIHKIYTWTVNLEEKFMGTLSIWHIFILAAAALLLFGGNGKISDLMGDVARGIKAFRAGLNDAEIDQTQLRAVPARRHEDTLDPRIDRHGSVDHRNAP
jgi:sec-independent protein translocase protein TatA